MKPSEKNYVIPSESFPVAKEFNDLLKDFEKQSLELTEQYQAQMNRLNEACKAEARPLWFKMAESVGIDAFLTWNDPSFFLDRTYMADNFAAIRQITPEPNPYNAMMQQQGIAGEDKPKEPTKGMT